MDFKKFKHEVKKEDFIIPSMSDKVKNYSKVEKVSYQKEEKERIALFPLFKGFTLLIPILIMLLAVCIISFVPNGDRTYNYGLYTIKDARDLQRVISIGKQFDPNIPGFGIGGSKDDFLEGAIPDMPNIEVGENSKPNYSETNKQEENVDEADIIKTDGYNIYYMSHSWGALFKYNLKTEQISKVEIATGLYTELFLTDKYLVVLGYKSTYYYSSDVIVNVYNKETLELVKDYKGYGLYVDSRITNDYLYLVYSQPNVQNAPSDIVCGETKVYPYTDIKYSASVINQGYTYILAMDLNSLEFDVHVQLGANYWQAVYMTENSLYLTSSTYCSSLKKYTLMGARYTISSYQTNIFRFELDGINIIYKGIIITSGIVNDQFYLDEYDNHLRVVLQQQNSVETGNNKLEVYDLKQLDNEGLYKKVASIEEGIGKPGEQIKSVRFSDNSCLIVTYLVIDPLYYIDLTDQLSPVIIGEYEEPGYNTYLHYLNDNLAIGFGVNDRETYEEDGTVIYSFAKIGLYDISSKTPIKIDENIKYESIDVVSNHKALYIEGEVFGFAGEYCEYNKYSGSHKSDYVYDIYTINYDNETPLLQLVKRFASTNEIYERMIRIDSNYYLVSTTSIQILDSNYEAVKQVIFK